MRVSSKHAGPQGTHCFEWGAGAEYDNIHAPGGKLPNGLLTTEARYGKTIQSQGEEEKTQCVFEKEEKNGKGSGKKEWLIH